MLTIEARGRWVWRVCVVMGLLVENLYGEKGEVRRPSRQQEPVSREEGKVTAPSRQQEPPYLPYREAEEVE